MGKGKVEWRREASGGRGRGIGREFAETGGISCGNKTGGAVSRPPVCRILFHKGAAAMVPVRSGLCISLPQDPVRSAFAACKERHPFGSPSGKITPPKSLKSHKICIIMIR